MKYKIAFPRGKRSEPYYMYVDAEVKTAHDADQNKYSYFTFEKFGFKVVKASEWDKKSLGIDSDTEYKAIYPEYTLNSDGIYTCPLFNTNTLERAVQGYERLF